MQGSREVVVIGRFPDASRAGNAVNALKQAGFTGSDISLFVSSSEQLAEQDSANTRDSLVAGAAALGAGIGIVLVGTTATSRSASSSKRSDGNAVLRYLRARKLTCA